MGHDDLLFLSGGIDKMMLSCQKIPFLDQYMVII